MTGCLYTVHGQCTDDDEKDQAADRRRIAGRRVPTDCRWAAHEPGRGRIAPGRCAALGPAAGDRTGDHLQYCGAGVSRTGRGRMAGSAAWAARHGGGAHGAGGREPGADGDVSSAAPGNDSRDAGRGSERGRTSARTARAGGKIGGLMIAVRWFMPILVALVATLWHVVPWLSRRERLFGATVTEEFRERERPALVREYELRLLPWTIAVVAGSLLLPLVTHPSWIWDIGFWLAVVLGGGWNVWRMFNRMPRAASGAARVRSAELTAGDPDATRSWPPILVALLAVPLGALAATTAYLYAHRAQLPQRFPMHWDLQGAPSRWAEHTAMGVYTPLAVGGA